MDNLISYEPGIVGDSSAISFVKMVKLNLVDASKAFFEIGFRLKEAQDNGYYKELGFNSLAECAEFHFNFKKTTTYDLIKIYEKFHRKDAPMRILEYFENFNQSQLSVIASYIPERYSCLYGKYVSLFSPADTVRKIKYASVCFKAIHNGCPHIPFNVGENAKSADELIANVQEYVLNNFSRCKANYPKVITPELEAKYHSFLCEPNAEAFPEQVDVEIEKEAIIEDKPVENDILELVEVLPGAEFSAPDEEDEPVELHKNSNLEKDLSNLREILYDKLYEMAFNLFEPGKGGKETTAFFADKVCSMIFNYFFINLKNVNAYLTASFSQYSYTVKLGDRKQPINVFIKNILNQMLKLFDIR